jgi:hypothetical protein
MPEISQLNHSTIDGEVTIQFDRPPDIKLSNAPKIVFAIPVGSKRLNTHFLCSKEHGGCGSEWVDVPAIATPSMVPVQTMLSYHNLQMPLNVSTTFLTVSGYLSSVARQIMTKRAIQMGAKYIVYWDDDTLPPSDAVFRLYNFLEKNPAVGICTAVVTTRTEPVEPVIYAAHGDGALWEFECGPGAIPTPIFASGGAFCMARISAIVDIIEKVKIENGGTELPIWADERVFIDYTDEKRGINKRGIMWGHDVRFYRLMQEAGYHTVVHGAVLCGHLDPQTGIVYEMPADAPGFKMVQERLNGKVEGQTGQSQESDARVQDGDAALGIEARAASH